MMLQMCRIVRNMGLIFCWLHSSLTSMIGPAFNMRSLSIIRVWGFGGQLHEGSVPYEA